MRNIADLKVDNLAYGNIQCSPEWQVSEKGAIFHRIYFVHGGQAVYKNSREEFALKKDFIYLFPANKPYEIIHDPLRPLDCLWFHVTTIPLILNPAVFVQVQENSSLCYLLKAIESLVGNRSEELNRADPLLSQLIESLVWLLHQEVGFSTLSDERLIKIMDYIHGHFHEKLTTERLSGFIGFDRSYFIRLFKKTFGVSPQDYISDFRFSKAASMLMENIPVSVVAGNVGFQDAKAFSRAFRKVKGISPSVCKKSQYLQP